MAFCILPEHAEKLKAAAKAGEITIEKLYTMSSQERRELFGKYVDQESAQGVNAGFEKAMASEQQKSLAKWVEKTFTATEKKKAEYKDILTKIDDLTKQGVLTPEGEKAFLQDLVTEKLGASISADEAKVIAEKSKKLEELYKPVESVLGIPGENEKTQEAYLAARRDMENYIDSLTPQSKLRVATGTVARGNMLFRLGSILVNINSNNLQGALESVVRRMDERRIGGLNNMEVARTVAFYTRMHRKTGYDLSRMESLVSERKILGEEYNNSQGKGLIRGAGRAYQDFIFGLTQGTPDVMAASFASSDRANLMSTRIALAKGLKGDAAKAEALRLFKDSMKIEPKTPEGQLIRKNAIADGLRSTNQDNRLLSERALKLRRVLNVGDLRFGDVAIPFVKTTANAIQSSLEASGVTVPVETLVRTIKMVKMVAGHEGSLGEVSREAFSGFGRTLVRAGLGTTGAFLVANAIDPKNYIGVYPTSPKEQELLRLRKAAANSINVGGNWVSLDWFGPLAAPLVGFLSAKKYGTTFNDAALNYYSGAGYQLLRTPGLDFIGQTLDYAKTTLQPNAKNTVDSRFKDAANYATAFFTSRAIPGFIGEAAQATDTVQREVKKKDDTLAPLKAAVPGLRQTLPARLTIFGETTPTEGWKTLLFGGRLKEGHTDPVIDEMVRLQDHGALPAIAPLDDPRAGSDRMMRLRSQIGDEKYREAVTQFGQKFHRSIEKQLSDSKYKSLPDDEKMNLINRLKDRELNAVLEKYGYKGTESKKKSEGHKSQFLL